MATAHPQLLGDALFTPAGLLANQVLDLCAQADALQLRQHLIGQQSQLITHSFICLYQRCGLQAGSKYQRVAVLVELHRHLQQIFVEGFLFRWRLRHRQLQGLGFKMPARHPTRHIQHTGQHGVDALALANLVVGFVTQQAVLSAVTKREVAALTNNGVILQQQVQCFPLRFATHQQHADQIQMANLKIQTQPQSRQRVVGRCAVVLPNLVLNVHGRSPLGRRLLT